MSPVAEASGAYRPDDERAAELLRAIFGRTTVKVTRRGDVLRNGRLIGSVDRHDGHIGPLREAKTWRYVTEGGRVSPDRYPTRAAAVAALEAL